ncbi:MAG: hypothetical protein ACK4NH_06520, partial [Gemmobacter sp.]
SSTLPVQWLLPVVGWRPLVWALAVLLALSALVIAWPVPAWADEKPEPSARPGSYAEVWRHPYFRQMTPVGFFSYGGMIAVQTGSKVMSAILVTMNKETPTGGDTMPISRP